MSPTSLARVRFGTAAVVSPVAMRRMAPTRVVTGRAMRKTRMYQVMARAARPLAKAAADQPESLRWMAFSSAKLAAEFSATRRSEEHTSELQSLMRISYAVFCLKKKKYTSNDHQQN